jgi:long-chain fatty acid transport protein
LDRDRGAGNADVDYNALRMWSSRLVALALLLVPAAAHASGFLLYEQSASALAKGSAVVASTRDSSAAWFNPAAIAYQPAYGASVSTALVFAHTRFSPAAGGDDVASQSRPSLVPSLFFQGRVVDRVHVSLALLAPFGLYVKWPDNWVGAQQSLKTDLKVLSANPSVAVRLHERVSVAGGLSVMRGLVDLSLGLPKPPDGRADLSGGAWGWGGNLAVLWRALPERLHLGATYRSRTRLELKGNADFTPLGPGFTDILQDQRVSATITLPDAFSFGVMYRPHPRLELDAQLDWVRWNSFKELYIDFAYPGTPDRRIQRSSVQPLTGRLGGEWSWPRWDLVARAGASFDQSASRKDTLAPSAPDARRLGLGTGLGYRHGQFTFDVGYLYAHFFPAEAAGPNAQPAGTYRTHAHVLALTVGVQPR